MKTLVNIFLVLLLFAVAACAVTKESAKKKTATIEAKDVSTAIVRNIQEKRKGGEIKTEIIPIENRERDENGDLKELVKTIKEGGLTKTVIYRPDGKVDVECTADEIYRLIEEKIQQREQSITSEQTKEKNKQKEEVFNPTQFVFGFIFLVVLILIGFFIMKRFIVKSLQKMSSLT